MNSYRVDLVLLTYNHHAYIEKCLTSIVEQTAFDQVRVILCDDKSDDGTSSICESFHNQHLNIEWTRNEVNKGFPKNMAFGLRQVSAPLFALMDGDDFYINPKKIEKQIDFLDQNPDYVGVGHEVQQIDENGAEIEVSTKENEYDLGPKQCILQRPFHTNTFVGRWDNNFDIDYWENYFLSSDMVMIHTLFHRGAIRVWPAMMSTYRRHPEGYSIAYDKPAVTLNLIETFIALNIYSKNRHKKWYHLAISNYYSFLFQTLLNKGKWNWTAILNHYRFGLSSKSINLKKIPWIIWKHLKN